MIPEVRIHDDHGVGVSIQHLPDGRHRVTIVDTVDKFEGVHITLTVPKCRNWTKRLGRAIRHLDYYELVLAELASPKKGKPHARPSPSVAALRLVK